jgi:hypothetical protein
MLATAFGVITLGSTIKNLEIKKQGIVRGMEVRDKG